MGSRSIRWLAAVALATCGLLAPVRAEVPVPLLTARVTDLTGTLAADQRSTLEKELRGIETRSTSQIAILMVPTTKPESIEQYSIRVVEDWKLGQQGKDNGVLILVAKDDRRVRLEVGYGLEGTIPDAHARQIIDTQITPRFKQGDYAGGLLAGVRQLAFLIEGRAAVASQTARLADAAGTEAPSEGLDARGAALPPLGATVVDLAGMLDDAQTHEAASALRERGLDQGKPFYVLIVPTTGAESLADYGARVLAYWGEAGRLDVARSGLLLIARDRGTAHLELGPALQARWAAGASAQIVSSVESALARGDSFGAVQTAIDAIGKEVAAVNAQRTLDERVLAWADDAPLVLVLAIVAFGTALRRILGPLVGAATTGALVGGGTWWLSGELDTALMAGGVSFVFVFVGLANWIAIGLSGSSGSSGRGGVGGGGFSSSGGGFSGGGGSFGGGGASGSW